MIDLDTDRTFYNVLYCLFQNFANNIKSSGKWKRPVPFFLVSSEEVRTFKSFKFLLFIFATIAPKFNNQNSKSSMGSSILAEESLLE